MRTAIKGVLFDIGGVLVDLDGMPFLAALLKSAESREALHDRWMASKAVMAYEIGQIGEGEFAVRLTEELHLAIGPKAFLEAFRAWPRSVQPGALDLIDRIPEGYLVAALSNMCAAHWERIAGLGLANRFGRTYLSFETGHLKPAPEAFKVALAGMCMHPSEVLFFDDIDSNVDAAKSLGIDAYLTAGPDDVERILLDYEIIQMNGRAPS